MHRLLLGRVELDDAVDTIEFAEHVYSGAVPREAVTGSVHDAAMYLSTRSPRHRVARERGPGYGASAPSLVSAVAKLREARAELAAVELDACSGEKIAEALSGLVAEESSLAVQEARLLREFDGRETYRRDACVSTMGWLRLQTQLSHAAAKRKLQRARLLERMPLLSEALSSAEVTTEHVDVIANRAIPARMERIAEHEETLTRLARDADPHQVKVLVKQIVEHIDPDGTDDPPACEAEDLREFRLYKGMNGLSNVSATTTPLLTELLMRARDLYGTPDPPETPPSRQRTPAQRWHDAIVAALAVAIDNHPGCAVDGVKTHAAVFVDLHTVLGEDELATIKPMLGTSGELTPDAARHLLATTNPTLRLVLGLGPWLPVSVGRARRGLPDALRGALQAALPKCTGPGCDRPFSWCDVDHRDEWWQGGITALINSGPMCPPHNNLKHSDGWIVTFDTGTGVTTWTSADRTRRIDVPPPDT